MTAITTSAPGKLILFGEHSVNRGQPALASAIDCRMYCRVTPRADDTFRLRSGDHAAEFDRASVLAFKREIDHLLECQSLDEIRAHTRREFFAPARYVLGFILERAHVPGLDVEWRSDLPTGSGLGSGAAASSALALGALCAAGQQPTPQDIAWLAWQGDVIAHGGVASGLDSGACALGGLIRYTLQDGPQPLPHAVSLPLVIGDTRVRARTAEVNTRVRTWLTAHPARAHLFADMGWLVRHALAALDTPSEAIDLRALGRLMNLNQLLLARLGVSCPEIDRLIDAALDAGALGAKLSGSGGGGIIIAVTEPESQQAIAAALTAAGGAALVAATAAPGVRIERELEGRNT